MIKPKPIQKKGKRIIQKKQRTNRPENLPRHLQVSFHNRTVLLIIILIITFSAFLPSLSNQFINTWDDQVYVTDNPIITHLNWESIKGFFTTEKNGTYVPIPLLSWALEFKFFGLNPFPYHLNNLLLHLLCTALVFYFFILLRLPALYAAFGALLFGIHPMHVESVAWVTERKDLLFCMFYLGSLITYIKYVHNENRKKMYFLLTLLLFVFSLFSKIQAVSLPLSLFLLDYFLDRPLKLKLLWEKIPFFILSLIFGLAGYFILQHVRAIDIHDKYTLFVRIFGGLFSLSAYIIKLIAPLNLSIYYPYPVEPGESLPVLYYLNPIFLIAIAILIFFTTRKTKAVVFGVLFFLFNVMFLLQFVRAGYAYQADRFTYVSYTGLFFLAVWAARKFANRNKSSQMVITGLTLVITIFFFSNTYARCKDWKDSLTLWNDVIEKFPGKIPRAYGIRGLTYRKLGQWDKAITDYSRAIEIDPNYTDAYNDRGLTYGNLGQWDKAITDYSRAIEIDPKYSLAYNNRGFDYANLNKWDKAIADYSKAIETDSKLIKAYANRGNAYGSLGQWDKAITDYTRIIEIDPKYAIAWYNHGLAYDNLGQWDKAIVDYSRAIEIDPNYTDAYNYRGLTYGNLGQWNKAIADYTRAIEIDPKDSVAYYNRDVAYRKLHGVKR
jgi:tetratricopeptide (TPR) repeat protein